MKSAAVVITRTEMKLLFTSFDATKCAKIQSEEKAV